MTIWPRTKTGFDGAAIDEACAFIGGRGDDGKAQPVAAQETMSVHLRARLVSMSVPGLDDG